MKIVFKERRKDMDKKVEVIETGLTAKTKVIIAGVVGFVGILTWIISKLLKKDNK